MVALFPMQPISPDFQIPRCQIHLDLNVGGFPFQIVVGLKAARALFPAPDLEDIHGIKSWIPVGMSSHKEMNHISVFPVPSNSNSPQLGSTYFHGYRIRLPRHVTPVCTT